jgi:uncharacterized protein YecE (DUF72 family)
MPHENIRADLMQFLELLEPLSARGKLGCLLIQLPPSFSYERNKENLETFLKMLPTDYDFSVEFRHKSWIRDETWPLLRKYNVSYCIVDEPLLPPEVHLTADFAYFRWHGRGSKPWYNYEYSRKELQEWVPSIKKVKKKVDRIYGYFNNHFHGYAVENCIEILEMLSASSQKQTGIKNRIVEYNKKKRSATIDRTLEEY